MITGACCSLRSVCDRLEMPTLAQEDFRAGDREDRRLELGGGSEVAPALEGCQSRSLEQIVECIREQALELLGPTEPHDQLERRVPIPPGGVVGQARRTRAVSWNESELSGALGEKCPSERVEIDMGAPLDEDADVERARRDLLSSTGTKKCNDELVIEHRRHRQRGQPLLHLGPESPEDLLGEIAIE